MNKELLSELSNPQNYEKNFKGRCVVCDCRIIVDWEFYNNHGNYCGRCSARCHKEGLSNKEENKRFRNLFKGRLEK